MPTFTTDKFQITLGGRDGKFTVVFIHMSADGYAKLLNFT